MAKKPPTRQAPPGKDEEIKVKLDSELAAQAKQKALRYGGLSAVVRALLRAWVERDIIEWDDIAVENLRAAKRKKNKE
jgi:Arc/MetJ-type ribon-helix-helix transcriptional regulator